MGFFKIIKRLIGGLNLDNTPNDLPQADFVSGYDVVDRNPSTASEDKYLQPENNNELAYNLNTIQEAGKVYQVTIDITNLTDCQIYMTVYGKYGYSWQIKFYYTTGQTVYDLFAEIQYEFSLYLPLDVPASATYDGNTLTFNLSLVNFLYYTDFFVSFSDNSPINGVYTIVATQDAISAEKVGTLVPIEFTNVNSAQQVWATPKSKEIEEAIATGTQINSGTDLQLQFSTNNFLQNGEEVYMYGNGVGLYVCVLSTVDPDKYIVAGSYDPFVGAGSCLFPAGDYTIVKNKRTLSTIGYATKDYLSDTWYYTELIRSINLNFRTYKQIQAYGMITNNGTIYNWTDYLNQIKRLYYFGTIMNQGFLTVYNPDGIYDLDTIGQESRLQLGTNTAKISLSIPSKPASSGTYYVVGSKLEGCYAAFVRFKTIDGFYSTYSKASNVQWLHSPSLETHEPTLNSGLSLNIFVEQIDYKIFDYLQVSIIHFTNTSWTGYSLPEQKINGLSELQIIDTGFNSAEYIDFNDANYYLNQIPFVFENAKSILPYNLYEVAANVNLIKERDLTEWAKTIQLTASRREYFGFEYTTTVNLTDFKNYIFKGINDYDKCSNEWMSYMPWDIYRFCVFIDWEDGSPTSTYWIDDVSFKPIDTGITDGDASYRNDEQIAPLLSNIYYYQYIVEATNINLDYVLPNGEYLRDIIKDIRFGRALCNKSVLATGLSIAVDKPWTTGSFPPMIYYDFGTFSHTISSASGEQIRKNKLVFYCPDLMNTGNNLNFNSIYGDYILGYECKDGVVRTNPSSSSSSNIYRCIPTNNGVTTDICMMSYPSGPWTGSYVTPNWFITVRGGVTSELTTDLIYLSDFNSKEIYYIRPYPSTGAYPISPENTQFFVIPQSQWFDKLTHNSSTVYSIFGGDVFPNYSVYKDWEYSELDSSGNSVNIGGNAVGFFSFNRTNAALRSGRYPLYTLSNYLENAYLTDVAYDGDAYGYRGSFTPRYPFQNSTSFNPELKQLTKLGTSIFYSEQSVSYDLAGGNRVWLPLSRKDLEATYGDIVHMEILLGFSETGLLIVWQPQRTTAQYFDNTANIKSSTGELLIGNGEIMGRKGADFTEYGCEHKWTIRKGQNPTGKDVVFWACFRKGAIMRLGADGTADLVGDINSLLTNKTFLALQNEFNNPDTPAHNYGCHAVWNNQTKEYILTLTLVPATVSKRTYSNGDWAIGTETWGFENFPVVYKSIGTNSLQPPYGNWEAYSGYDNDVFQIWTLVWNELDNKFKTFRTFNPKIYGQFNNTYVSSHPNYPDKIYEHNKNVNEALFYCTEERTEIEAVTNPELYRIEGAGIESILPFPFAPHERTKFVVKIEGKNFEIVGSGTDYLQMASIDNDDILPEYTWRGFVYYICNSQDPYIEGVVNESMPRYVNFVLKNTQADDTLKRVEYFAGYDSLGTVTTQSFTNKEEEEFYNGESNVQIKMDTTNNPTDNEVGENLVEGKWMKFKQFWRWGKKNRVLTTSVAIEETEYKKK